VDTWAAKGVAATIDHVLAAPALSIANWPTAAAADDGSNLPVRWGSPGWRTPTPACTRR